jgi:hypothetical protein
MLLQMLGFKGKRRVEILTATEPGSLMTIIGRYVQIVHSYHLLLFLRNKYDVNY